MKLLLKLYKKEKEFSCDNCSSFQINGEKISCSIIWKNSKGNGNKNNNNCNNNSMKFYNYYARALNKGIFIWFKTVSFEKEYEFFLDFFKNDFQFSLISSENLKNPKISQDYIKINNFNEKILVIIIF